MSRLARTLLLLFVLGPSPEHVSLKMQMHNPVVLALGHQNQSDVAYYSEACFPGWKFIKGTCRPVLHAFLGHVHFLKLKKFTRQLTCLQSTSG